MFATRGSRSKKLVVALQFLGLVSVLFRLKAHSNLLVVQQGQGGLLYFGRIFV